MSTSFQASLIQVWWASPDFGSPTLNVISNKFCTSVLSEATASLLLCTDFHKRSLCGVWKGLWYSCDLRHGHMSPNLHPIHVCRLDLLKVHIHMNIYDTIISGEVMQYHLNAMLHVLKPRCGVTEWVAMLLIVELCCNLHAAPAYSFYQSICWFWPSSAITAAERNVAWCELQPTWTCSVWIQRWGTLVFCLDVAVTE